jgi:cytochrome c biogenesis protein
MSTQVAPESTSETASAVVTPTASPSLADTKKSPEPKEPRKKEKSVVDQILAFLSSVKLGVSLLVILMIFSMIGTFVVQQDTADFQKFFESLTPAEEALYRNLGFFDIYHSWYFNLLLITLSLNIILASIDRAPGYWHFFVKPKLTISENDAKYQQLHTLFKMPNRQPSEIIQKLSEQSIATLLPRWAAILGPLGPKVARLAMFRYQVTEGKDGATTVFVERSVWNRWAFCAVHVALLMILGGWFVGIKWGKKGVVSLAPGQRSATFISPAANNTVKSFEMPFRLFCYDIEQDLIDSAKPDLSPSNTLDWHTRVVFEDQQGGRFKGNVHLNSPVDFRGYRFFQASFDPMNSARNLTLLLNPKDGQGQAQEVTLKRNSVTDVPGVGKVQWRDFYPDFRYDQKASKPFSASGDYNFPVAEVDVVLGDGSSKTVLGLTAPMLESVKSAPFLAERTSVGDYNVVLKDFEKVSRAHTLQVQYDPGVDVIYWGCGLLVLFLLMLFFSSHERLWVLIKPNQDGLQLYFAGNTNRNRPALEVRYLRLLENFRQAFQDAIEVAEKKAVENKKNTEVKAETKKANK